MKITIELDGQEVKRIEEEYALQLSPNQLKQLKNYVNSEENIGELENLVQNTIEEWINDNIDSELEESLASFSNEEDE